MRRSVARFCYGAAMSLHRRVDEATLERIAESLGAVLVAGDVVCLRGEMGAGKTTFVRALARGMGITRPDRVASPTYTMVDVHDGPLPLVHVDLHRVTDRPGADEADEDVDAADEAYEADREADRAADAAGDATRSHDELVDTANPVAQATKAAPRARTADGRPGRRRLGALGGSLEALGLEHDELLAAHGSGVVAVEWGDLWPDPPPSRWEIELSRPRGMADVRDLSVIAVGLETQERCTAWLARTANIG